MQQSIAAAVVVDNDDEDRHNSVAAWSVSSSPPPRHQQHHHHQRSSSSSSASAASGVISPRNDATSLIDEIESVLRGSTSSSSKSGIRQRSDGSPLLPPLALIAGVATRNTGSIVNGGEVGGSPTTATATMTITTANRHVVEELGTSLSTAESARAAAERERDEAQWRCREAETHARVLEQRIGFLEQEMREYRVAMAERDDLAPRVAALTAAKHAAEMRVEILEREKESAEAKVKEMIMVVEAARASSSSSIITTATNTSIALGAKVNAMESKVLLLTSQTEELLLENDQLHTQLEAMTARMKRLKQATTAAQQSHHSNKGEVGKRQQRWEEEERAKLVAQYEEQLAKHAEQVRLQEKRHQEQVAALQEEADHWKSKLAQVETQQNHHPQQRQSSQRRSTLAGDLSIQLSSAEARLEELSSQCTQLIADNRSLRLQLKEADAIQHHLSSEAQLAKAQMREAIEAHSDSGKQWAEERDGLLQKLQLLIAGTQAKQDHEKLKELEERLTAAERNAAIAEASTIETRRANQTLEKELQRRQAHDEAVVARVTELDEENAKLRSLLEDARGAIIQFCQPQPAIAQKQPTRQIVETNGSDGSSARKITPLPFGRSISAATPDSRGSNNNNINNNGWNSTNTNNHVATTPKSATATAKSVVAMTTAALIHDTNALRKRAAEVLMRAK